MADIYLGGTSLADKELYVGTQQVTAGYLGGTQVYSPGGGGGGVVTDDLILYFDANDAASYPGSGTTVTDLSGQGNDGTMQNSLPVNTSGGVKYWDWGDSNNTRHITVNHSSDFNMSTAISMECWFWIPDFSKAKNGEQHYFAKRKNNSSHSAAGYQFVMRSRPDSATPTLTSWVNTEGSGNGENYGYSGFGSAVWQQWVATWNNTDNFWRYYWNGSLIHTSAAKTQPYASATSGDLYLGAHIAGQYGQPKGRQSIYRLYKDRELSAAEVLQNYNADKATFGL